MNDETIPAASHVAPVEAITGEALAGAVKAALPAERIIADRAKHVAPDHVLLARGGRLSARHVIDARGASKFPTLDCGWQKFVGQALTVGGGHGVAHPVVMDATVEQLGGYRFVYLLPLDAETLFVEDTYYSDKPDLNRRAMTQRIAAYAEAKAEISNELRRGEIPEGPVTHAESERVIDLAAAERGREQDEEGRRWPADHQPDREPRHPGDAVAGR